MKRHLIEDIALNKTSGVQINYHEKAILTEKLYFEVKLLGIIAHSIYN